MPNFPESAKENQPEKKHMHEYHELLETMMSSSNSYMESYKKVLPHNHLLHSGQDVKQLITSNQPTILHSHYILPTTFFRLPSTIVLILQEKY